MPKALVSIHRVMDSRRFKDCTLVGHGQCEQIENSWSQ
jgi:hypothetical protein